MENRLGAVGSKIYSLTVFCNNDTLEKLETILSFKGWNFSMGEFGQKFCSFVGFHMFVSSIYIDRYATKGSGSLNLNDRPLEAIGLQMDGKVLRVCLFLFQGRCKGYQQTF